MTRQYHTIKCHQHHQLLFKICYLYVTNVYSYMLMMQIKFVLYCIVLYCIVLYCTMVERWLHTRHTNGMSCWRYFVLCMSVNLQHDTPKFDHCSIIQTSLPTHGLSWRCNKAWCVIWKFWPKTVFDGNIYFTIFLQNMVKQYKFCIMLNSAPVIFCTNLYSVVDGFLFNVILRSIHYLAGGVMNVDHQRSTSY